MQQITVTVDMTPENLEILKQLCPAGENKAPAKPEAKKTAKKTTDKPTSVEAAADTGAGAPETVETGAPTEKTETKVELTDVRAVALKLSKAGKQDVLKAAFAKFGGKKLSDIKPDDYAALMAELTKEVGDNA